MSNYNFNEELCKRLTNSEIAVHYNNGNLDMLRALLKKCAPKDGSTVPCGIYKYYFNLNGYWHPEDYTNKPTVPLSDFIVKDSKNENPFVWDDELVKEFALQAKVNGASDWVSTQIEQFKASKQRKCLFTTEDGKQIFEGDEYFYLCTTNWHITGRRADKDEEIVEGFKDFSTEAAAREYVRLNKPEYSLNDIAKVSEKLDWKFGELTKLKTELEKLKQ